MQRENQQRRNQAWRHQIAVTAHPHRFQRHDLLRVPLDAEFRRQSRTRLTHQHQSRQHRRHFPHQTQGHQRPEQTRRAKAVEDVVTLQTQHEAGEHAHNQDDWQTQRALLINRPGNATRQPAGFHRGTE